jgi:hypothetical protein
MTDRSPPAPPPSWPRRRAREGGAAQIVVLHALALQAALEELAKVAERPPLDDVVEQVVDALKLRS